MSTLGKAVIEFSADTARFVGDVGAAASKFDRSMQQMQRGVEMLRNAFFALGALGGISVLVKGAIDAGDQLAKLSQQVGLSVERLSELKLAAELGGVDLDGFTKGMREFNRSMVEARDGAHKSALIFKSLGVDITAGPDAAFRQFAEALSKLPDGEAKTTAAMEILGRTGAELIPVMNGGAKALDDAAEKARKLGLVISTETAKQSEQFNDQVSLLTRNTQALGIAIADKLVPPLAKITQNMLEARVEGDLFNSMLEEMGRIALATSAKLTEFVSRGVGPIGTIAKFLRDPADAAAEKAFNKSAEPDPWAIARANILKRQQGTWTGAPEFGDTGPDPNVVACAASGGKWENGKCVRIGGSNKKTTDNSDAQYAAALQQQNDMLDEANRLGVEFLKTQEKQRLEQKKYFEDLERRTEAERMIALYARQEERDSEIRERYMAERIKQTKELDDVARDLGFTFASAFEDAIIEGKKFSDVLKAIAQDIARIVLRKTVTEPAADAITKLVKGFDFGSIFGGGKALGGPVMGGTSYMVGERGPELFTPGASGIITPNHALGGAQQSLTINIDSRTDQSQVMRLVRAAVEQGNAMLLDQMQRGATRAGVAVGRA